MRHRIAIAVVAATAYQQSHGFPHLQARIDGQESPQPMRWLSAFGETVTVEPA
jgi:hypothetical protein